MKLLSSDQIMTSILLLKLLTKRFTFTTWFLVFRLGGASSSSRYATTGICQCQNRSHVWRIFVFFFAGRAEKYSRKKKTKLPTKSVGISFNYCSLFFSKILSVWKEQPGTVSENHTHERNATDTWKRATDGRNRCIRVCVCVCCLFFIDCHSNGKEITHIKEGDLRAGSLLPIPPKKWNVSIRSISNL